MRQAHFFASIADETSANSHDSTPQAAPIELDVSLLTQISGAGPCGGWQSVPVQTDKGPCGGW